MKFRIQQGIGAWMLGAAFLLFAGDASSQTREPTSGASTTAGAVPTLTSSQRSTLSRLESRRQRAHAQIQKGLVTRRPSGSVRRIETGLRTAETALKMAARAKKRYARYADFQRALAPIQTRIENELVEGSMHLASAYTVRGSHTKALATLNRALAIDSRNAAALAQRARIELAASEGVVAVGGIRGAPVVISTGR